MPWKIKLDGDDVVIVEMDSNPINKMNAGFFSDLQTTFDTLDKDFPAMPLVITGNQKMFSAGLDIEFCFDIFASQNHAKIRKWFTEFSNAIMRVFESNRLTVAAINGHSFAGGIILALCCDFRFGIDDNSKYSLNEVPIGIPMPATYAEIIRYRIGEKNASDAILSGSIYNAKQAKEIHFVHDLVSTKEDLLAGAIKQARCISKVAWPAYAQSKKVLRAATLKKIKETYLPNDLVETVEMISCDSSIAAQKKALEALKRKGK